MSVGWYEQLRQRVGQEVALSEWLLITQKRITCFAEVTNDPDWMHVDPARAASGPVGQTIAQGFLTLALLTYFNHQAGYLPTNIAHAFNYGLDRVRWINPVKVGARIRNHTVLNAVELRAPNRYLLTTTNTVEIEGELRPAMTARWLGLLQLSAADATAPPSD